jgi:hypothetical protein
MSPTDRLNAAPRCHATSKRTGNQCRGPAVNGWRVCRFHGARGGAPRGPANGAYASGLYTREALAARKHVTRLLKRATKLADAVAEGEVISIDLILMEDAS